MEKINRDQIHLIGAHSNWSEGAQQQALHENVYADKAAWQQFLRLLFLSLGVGLMTAGVLFFFAYNWADLSKFAKFGLIEGLLIGVGALVLFSKFNKTIRQVLLTGMAVLVGVLFAVFGQIYQTGADSYSFFLAWAVFIAIWVAVADFPPLWAMFIALLNTTLHLYYYQTTIHSTLADINFNMAMFLLNGLIFVFFAAFGFIEKIKDNLSVPNWFLNLLGLYVIGLGTTNSLVSLFERNGFGAQFFITFSIVAATFALGLFYAVSRKNLFLLAIIPFSGIVIATGLLVKTLDSLNGDKFDNATGITFVASIFVIISVSLLVKFLLGFSRKQGI